jgi:hypothetical protein
MILAHMDDYVSTIANVDVIFVWYFVPITCHENIMQVSIFYTLLLVLDSTLSLINFENIFAYNIARFITLAICSKYVWIGFQTFTILFVEIILTTCKENLN